MSKTVGIIGAGIGGLALSIRLANQGFKVTIFEKNSYPGGKLSELKMNGFRFDKGPSLFTMPSLIDELTNLQRSAHKFEYQKLAIITNYFYSDGTQLKAAANLEDFAEEVHLKLNEKKETVLKHIKRNAFYFKTTEDLFLKQSLHQLKNFINLKTVKGILYAPFLGLFSTMNEKNKKTFSNPKTAQLFNRFATYNGSNPYKAPALINMISHLEFNLGAYLPNQGMHQITTHLVKLAEEANVTIKYKAAVETLDVGSNNRITGIKSNGVSYPFDIVASDVDIHLLYNYLLPKSFTPKKLIQQEKSSSAYVFYWGINKEFAALGLHNILFSDDYKKEFDYLFSKQFPTEDPTIYINITSKYCKDDAPEGCENWFVMVNVPHNKSDSIIYTAVIRKNVVAKINAMLKTDIEKHIISESTLSPIDIENQTSSFGGSLYGNSSNNKFAAFLRHANFSSTIKNLYLVGGSVHPGGGIPLCLFSAKIASQIIVEREKKMKEKYKSYFLYFLILVYVSGSIGFVLNPSFFSPFTPYTLLLTCFVFLIHSPLPFKKFIFAFFSIAVLSFMIEVIGVKTGFIFGKYSYGDGLGYKLFEVPLIISINWAILICAGIRIVSSIFANKITVLAVAALLVTGIDLLIEQVAPKLDFWQFEGGLPSLHNYFGWIGVAFFTSYIFYPTIIKGNRKVSFIILILQIIFFTSLFIFI